jgi:pimeloyl-ACP methyl ester carboxylesterase
MIRVLLGFTAGLLLATAVGAEEIWQTVPLPPAMPTPRESGLAPVDDIQMYYAIYGEGDPVLLIHGGLGNADEFGYQVPALAESHEVIVADGRGHGRSTSSDKPWSHALFADDYVALLDYLKIDKTALVGWSDGAVVGLDIAIRHPERLSRLFANGANYTAAGFKASAGDTPTFKAGFAHCAADYARMSPTPAGFDAMVARMSEMWATTPDYAKDQMRGIHVPTVIFDGDHDEGIEPAHSAEMAELIPGAKLIIMKDASHFAMWQKPDEFNAILLEFLAGKQPAD